MTDFAARDTTDGLDLTNAVRREVVLEVELLGVLVSQTIHNLLIFERTQGADHERLRLTSGEHGRTVKARLPASDDLDWADIRKATTVRPAIL